MDRWELIDTGGVPDSTKVMELWRRGREIAIRVDGRQLMSSLESGSEEALADLACDRIGDRPDARLLIGGLGMGFTLAAALRRVGPEASVVVAELVDAIVRWNGGPIGPVAGWPLRDPRATLFPGDVADAIRVPGTGFDAILLDVDNGPVALTRASNGWLYTWQGLASARAALRPAGVLAVWSAAPDAAFSRRLGHAGFAVEEVEVRARGPKGGHRHHIWLARTEC
jgi:spermidine synthase